MSLPKDVGTPSCYQSVVRIFWVSRAEGWSLGQNNEENDGSCEQIDLGSIVLLAQVNLRSHLACRAELRVEHT